MALVIVGVSIILSDILLRIHSGREKRDFRSGVAAETYSILKKFTDPLHHYDISPLIWSGKTPESKAAILGKEDYLVLRSFYDALEERNSYFAGRQMWSLQTVEPLNRKCVETLSRAYSEVTWLRTASDTDSLLSSARKSVGLPESPLETTKASIPQTMPETTVQSPELVIAPADLKEHEKVKEIQLVLRDGRVITHEARLYYITVTNIGKRSLRVSARFNWDQQMIFVPLNKKPTFRVVSQYYTDGFKREVETFGDEEAIAIALNTDERWVSRYDVTIHPGPAGETFVLFFTLKGFRVMTVPGGTRIYPNYDVGFPCKLSLGVCLLSDDLSPYSDATVFEVTAKNWKDFEVKQVGKTVRQLIP